MAALYKALCASLKARTYHLLECGLFLLFLTVRYLFKRNLYLEILPDIFPDLTMEQQALHLLAVLRNSTIPLDTKIDLLTKLKTHIKHHHVPEPAINPSFEVVRLAISNSQFLDAGFSILSHLTKRLELQEQLTFTAAQGKKTYPIILERLGDAKDRVRLRAIQVFTEFWKASRTDVEQLIRDSALSGKSPRAKEAAMQWILKVR